jgi:hypothetical protein
VTGLVAAGTVPGVQGRTRWERDKRQELEACNADLVRARAALDTLIRHSHERGLDVEELEDLGPVSLEIARLRNRGHRLADELAAIHAEWAA